MNSNNSIIKSGGNSGNNTISVIESRLQKLEQVLQGLIQIIGGNASGGTTNAGNNLQNLTSIMPKISSGALLQGANGQISINPTINPTVGSGNIPNAVIKHLSLSQGQVIAELAAAIMKANQRNT